MFDDLKDLYQEVILDHSKAPRNCCKLKKFNHSAEGDNPICGDQLTIYAQLNMDDQIKDISFEGQGCAISTASASMMTDLIKGKSEAEFKKFFTYFQALCTNDETPVADGLDEMQVMKLNVLAGVKQFPMRVKCATLAWHTLKAALENKKIATTEHND